MFALFPSLSHANNSPGFFSSYYLRDLCASDEKGRETVKGGHSACQSYIAGIIDYHKLLKSLGTAPSIDICVPNAESMRKLQNIVYVYLAKNAQHSDFLASPAVMLALYDYYPCKEKGKKKRKR